MNKKLQGIIPPMVTPLLDRAMQISNTIYSVGKYGSGFLKGVKCSLSLLGICDDFIGEPFRRFREVERQRVKEALSNLGNFSDLF